MWNIYYSPTQSTCDSNYQQISSLKRTLTELMKTEAPLVRPDLSPTTVEGTFTLPKGILFSSQIVQLKSQLDDLCLSTYHILQRHLPPLEDRADEVQREIWTLSQHLTELRPQKEPLEIQEQQRREELTVVAEYKKHRIVRQAEEKERQKQRILARLEEERLTAQQEALERETYLKANQASAEQRAMAHLREVCHIRLACFRVSHIAA